MARLHGRNGRLYAGIASGGTAEPISFVTKWSVSFTTDKADLTALGDSNKVYASGLPDAKGTYNGWYDDATAQLYTASQDGVARKFYLYPAITNTGQYFFGTALFDFDMAGGWDEGEAMSGSWAAASSIAKVG